MPDYIKIKIRRGSTADWEASNPVLELGEIGADTTKHLLKVGNGSSTWKVLPYYAVEVVDDLTSGGTDKALSAEQGKELKELVDGKADSTDLDALEDELKDLIDGSAVVVEDNLTSNSRVNALSANQGRILKGLVDAASGGNAVVVEDSLTSTSTENALSANQGRVLNGKIPSVVDSLTSDSTTAALSAKQGKALKALIDAKPSGGGGTSVTVEDNLTSTSTVNALSANQGRVLGDKIKGMGIFGMGYTVDEFNAYDKPTKITFEDGVTCTLNWIGGTILRNIAASTGEVITMNYDTYGKIIGRTITR